MSTQVMAPPSLSINTTPSQTEQLWKIIEKQRSIIQDLQLNLAKVTEERNVLIKQASSTTHSTPPDIDHYARRPLPLEPSLHMGSEVRTSSPIHSVKTCLTAATTSQMDSPTLKTPTNHYKISPSCTTPTLNPTSSSPVDFLFFNDLKKSHSNNTNTTNDLVSSNPQHITLGDSYNDDDTQSTRKVSPMDEEDILLYTKYHEAVRSRRGTQPIPFSSSPLAFITHSPLPTPPPLPPLRRHPIRQQSAIQPINSLTTNSFLASNVSFNMNTVPSNLDLSQTPQTVPGQQQETSYTLRRFMEEEPLPLTTTIATNDDGNQMKRSMSVKQQLSKSLDMVQYEDDFYDPSLQGGDQEYGAIKSPNTPNYAHQPPAAKSSSSVPMLKNITVQILSSNMTTNEKGKQLFSFTISVGKFSPSSQGMEQLWCLEKLLSDFVNLDHLIKSKHPELASKLCNLPDRSLFVSRAPSKVDERKKAMEKYIQHMLTLPLTEISDICEFLSTNILEQKSSLPTRKIGYLTKRGKNFGGWKIRFFVLDGPVVNYYENKGGPHLGTINLARAQIGRQVEKPGAGDSFRHAFLILEPKKSAPNGIHRHVLCADSDMERDQWVETMSQYINYDDFGQPPPTPATPDYRQQLNKILQRSKSDASSFKNRKNNPYRHIRQRSSLDGANLIYSSQEQQQQQDESSNDDKKNKSRGFWGKKMFNTNNNNSNGDNLAQTLNGALSVDQATALMSSIDLTGHTDTSNPTNQGKKGLNQVFGVSLDEAVQVCRISQEYELPAVVYRCIEYLEAKDAAQEEGIYRLSGSAFKIKKLKEKFNQEGDVKLLDLEEYNHEVHAIAGLLKMWLRELPGNVLTTDLLTDFLHIADIEDRVERTTELGRLVSLLPLSNYTLLRTLSAHLIHIVQNAGVNKMTLRNLGIVFSATLGIPALVFNLFISEFDYVFWTKQNHHQPILPPPSTHSLRPQSDEPVMAAMEVQHGADAPSNDPTTNSSSPPPILPISIHRRSNRNSIHYTDYAPKSIVSLEKRSKNFVGIIDEEDEDNIIGLDYDEIMIQQKHHVHQRPTNNDDPTYEYTATVIKSPK
ncbi:hypothetical protein BC941DRAFT_407203 [Chlamydoabsidia padenii]|nr:hypothetical protein BC941DRAFT_407203 [Chlamydoabsidia padenii]